MGVYREGDSGDEGWRDTGSRSKRKGVIRVRGCLGGYRLCEEPVGEGREVTNSMGNGGVQLSLLGRELCFH